MDGVGAQARALSVRRAELRVASWQAEALQTARLPMGNAQAAALSAELDDRFAALVAALKAQQSSADDEGNTTGDDLREEDVKQHSPPRSCGLGKSHRGVSSLSKASTSTSQARKSSTSSSSSSTHEGPVSSLSSRRSAKPASKVQASKVHSSSEKRSAADRPGRPRHAIRQMSTF